MEFSRYQDCRNIIRDQEFHRFHTLVCVACRNTDRQGRSRPMQPCYRLRRSASRAEHVAQVLPCGHFMGSSCIASAKIPECPSCGVLFKRLPKEKGHCPHPIKHPHVLYQQCLTGEDECSLIGDGSYLSHPKCEDCFAQEKLLDLTAMLRRKMTRIEGIDDVKAVYATNGRVHGLFDGEGILVNPETDPQVDPSLVDQEILAGTNRIQQSIHGRYHRHDHKTNQIVFKVGVCPDPSADWYSNGSSDGSDSGSGNSDNVDVDIDVDVENGHREESRSERVEDEWRVFDADDAARVLVLMRCRKCK